MIKILQQIKRKVIAIIEKLIKNYHKKNPDGSEEKIKPRIMIKCVPIDQYVQRPDVKYWSSTIEKVVNGYANLCSDLMKEKSPNSSSLDKWARNKYIEYSCLPIL